MPRVGAPRADGHTLSEEWAMKALQFPRPLEMSLDLPSPGQG